MTRHTSLKQTALPVRWDELTASDFPRAIQHAAGVCVLPIGCLEKHGPHLPLGTDVISVNAVAVRAAKREYAVVFPDYYFGQISEARHQPGCIALRPDLLYALLQNVCDEIARNGFGKILIVNGHGGNNHWLHFFCETQLASRKNYVTYYLEPKLTNPPLLARIQELRKTTIGGHACEPETSWMLALRPDLVQLERAGDESGEPQAGYKHLPGIFSGTWWYATSPNHYRGDARPSTAELGEVFLEGQTETVVRALLAVKKDRIAPRVQHEFYGRTENPVRKREQPGKGAR